MKNIAVPAVLVIIFLFTYPALIHSQHSKYIPGIIQENPYVITISPLAGFVYGQAFELVYQEPSINDMDYYSFLTWDMKPVFYLGLQLEFNKADIMNSVSFFSSLSLRAGIPGDSGYLENSDWLSTTHNNRTDFSKHTNRTNEYFQADAVLGISIPIKSFFFIKTFVNGSCSHFSFLGYDGYGEYPENSRPENRKVDFTGQKIHTYKQEWYLAALGVSIGTKILYPFSFELSFRISPLTYCVAIDEHLGGVRFPSGHVTSNRTYLDFTRFGLYMEPGCSIAWSLQKVDFSLDFNYRYIGNTTGITYKDKEIYPTSNAGSALSLMDFSFLVKIII